MTDTGSIAEVLNLAQELSSILEEEFSVLESKNLEALETIQERKVVVLQQLDASWASLNAQHQEDPGESVATDNKDSLWEEAVSLINTCKEAHIRNDLLLKKQLEIVRNILSALTQKSDKNYGDLYDKLGRMSKKR